MFRDDLRELINEYIDGRYLDYGVNSEVDFINDELMKIVRSDNVKGLASTQFMRIDVSDSPGLDRRKTRILRRSLQWMPCRVVKDDDPELDECCKLLGIDGYRNMTMNKTELLSILELSFSMMTKDRPVVTTGFTQGIIDKDLTAISLLYLSIVLNTEGPGEILKLIPKFITRLIYDIIMEHHPEDVDWLTFRAEGEGCLEPDFI